MRLRSNSNKAPTKIVLLSFTKFRQIVSCYVFVLRLEQHIVFAILLMAGIFSSPLLISVWRWWPRRQWKRSFLGKNCGVPFLRPFSLLPQLGLQMNNGKWCLFCALKSLQSTTSSSMLLLLMHLNVLSIMIQNMKSTMVKEYYSFLDQSG